MAWTAPITFVNGVALTAAQLNAMQNNLLETAVAKTTATGQYAVGTGANSLANRAVVSDVIDSIATTSSTTYVGTAMPTVSVTTGAQALIFLYAYCSTNTNSTSAFYNFTCSGATTQTANDNRALATGQFTSVFAVTASVAVLDTGLTPGTNAFTACVKVNNATATGTFDHRRLAVMPF